MPRQGCIVTCRLQHEEMPHLALLHLPELEILRLGRG